MHARQFQIDPEILPHAHRAGFVRIATADLAREARVSEATVRQFLRGRVGPQAESAIRRALGAPEKPANASNP